MRPWNDRGEWLGGFVQDEETKGVNMDGPNFFTSDRIVIWLRLGNREPYPDWDNIAIWRLIERKREEFDRIIFELTLPEGLEIARRLDTSSVLEVRHVPVGRFDNPWNGTTLCYIKNFKPREQWINRLTKLDHNAEITRLYLHADCKIDWVIQ